MELYIISKILKAAIKQGSYKDIIFFVMMVASLMVGYSISLPLFRMTVSTIVLIIFSKLILRQPMKQTFCSVVLAQLIYFVSEVIFALTVSLIFHFNTEQLVAKVENGIIINFSTSLIALCISKIPIVKSGFANMMKIFNNITGKKLVGIIGISIFIINLLFGSIYYEVNVVWLMIINGLFVGFIIYILYRMFDEQNEIIQAQNRILIAEKKNVYYEAENNALLNTLNEYERIADQHRVINHENKNQLYAVKQMVNNEDEKTEIVGYIDTLLDDTKKTDETIVAKTKRIPSGGLQGIIYQKFVVMKKKNIKVSLNISRSLKDLDFTKLGMDTNVDMCKIIGVFLDNAIDEVKGLQEKVIDIELYRDGKTFCIAVTNSYGKNKDWEEIDNLGYSSKGEGHGYGLSLVKQILAGNKRLENERSITGNYFTQILKIKNMK